MKPLFVAALLAVTGILHAQTDPIAEAVSIVEKAPTGPSERAAYIRANLPAIKAAVDVFLAGPERPATNAEKALANFWYAYGTKFANTPENIELLRRFGLKWQMVNLTVKTPQQYAALKAADWILNGLEINEPSMQFIIAASYSDWPEADRILTEHSQGPSFWWNGVVGTHYRAWFAWKTAGKTPREVYDLAIAQTVRLETVPTAKATVTFLNGIADSRYLILQRERALTP